MEALLIDVLAEVLPLSGRVDLDPLAFPQRVGLVPGHCFIRAHADGGTIKHVTGGKACVRKPRSGTSPRWLPIGDRRTRGASSAQPIAFNVVMSGRRRSKSRQPGRAGCHPRWGPADRQQAVRNQRDKGWPCLQHQHHTTYL